MIDFLFRASEKMYFVAKAFALFIFFPFFVISCEFLAVL